MVAFYFSLEKIIINHKKKISIFNICEKYEKQKINISIGFDDLNALIFFCTSKSESNIYFRKISTI
jgi:hypothetical protein